MKPGSTPWRLVQKKAWRDSLPIDMLLPAVSVLVVAQPISEIPEGLKNHPVYIHPILDGNRQNKTTASPVFACLHSKQITVLSVLDRRSREKILLVNLKNCPVLCALLPWLGVKYKASR